jgi:hypothetical protein
MDRELVVATRPLSLVLRALPEPAAAGELVGHVEVVATGEVAVVRSLNELGDVLRRVGASATVEL